MLGILDDTIKTGQVIFNTIAQAAVTYLHRAGESFTNWMSSLWPFSSTNKAIANDIQDSHEMVNLRQDENTNKIDNKDDAISNVSSDYSDSEDGEYEEEESDDKITTNNGKKYHLLDDATETESNTDTDDPDEMNADQSNMFLSTSKLSDLASKHLLLDDEQVEDLQKFEEEFATSRVEDSGVEGSDEEDNSNVDIISFSNRYMKDVQKEEEDGNESEYEDAEASEGDGLTWDDSHDTGSPIPAEEESIFNGSEVARESLTSAYMLANLVAACAYTAMIRDFQYNSDTDTYTPVAAGRCGDSLTKWDTADNLWTATEC